MRDSGAEMRSFVLGVGRGQSRIGSRGFGSSVFRLKGIRFCSMGRFGRR